MRNTAWKMLGVLGGVIAMTAGTGTLAYAEETSSEITNDNSTLTVSETDVAWENRAAADVDSYINIRQSPSTEAETIAVLPKGAYVEVIEQNDDGWTKVTSGDIDGYIKSDLLVFSEEAEDLYEETYGMQGTITASVLRVRNGADLEASQIGSKAKGSSVKILGQEGDWYKIEYGTSEGYVFSEYVELTEVTAMSLEEYKESNSAVSVSNGELALLAAIIQCEAGGESHTGKVAVGAVIMNRVRSSSFPDTISEVVYQSGQFSPVSNGSLSTVLAQGARSDCYQAAQEALDGSNPIGDALYFNSGYGRGIQIGYQHFY